MLNAATSKRHNTPLIIAVIKGNIGIARLLIESGADVSFPDSQGRSPVDIAVNKNEIEIIKLLIESGAVSESLEYLPFLQSYITNPDSYYSFCKKYASPDYQLPKEEIKRKTNKVVLEVLRILKSKNIESLTLEQIIEKMDLIEPEELYLILRKIDEEFFDNEAFEMFRKNGCCVKICAEDRCYYDPTAAGFLHTCCLSNRKYRN